MKSSPLIIICCIIILKAETSHQGQAYEYFLDGEYAVLQKKYEQAESNFSKALFLYPDSPTILQSLVDLKLYQGEYDDAINYLKKILEFSPKDKISGLDLVQLYFQVEKSHEANELLNRLLEYFPDDIELLYVRASNQYSNQDWPNLLKTYYSIYMSDIGNTDILLKIYEIGLATGNESNILEMLQEIRIENETPFVLELLIELLSRMEKFADAIENLHRLMEIDGYTEEQIINLGELYLLNKQFNHVIITIEPIYQSGNHSLDVLRLLLITYAENGNLEGQLAVSLTLTEEYPKLPFGYETLSSTYLGTSNEVDAINVLYEALNKFPNEAIFPYRLAKIYYSAKNYLKAEKYFMDALKLNSKMVSIQHTLAIMYEDMAEIVRSDSLFKIIILNNEDRAVGLNDYAYIISQRYNSSLDELNYALKLAAQAILLEPENAAFLDTIGWIYYKIGSYKKAKEYLEKSLKINNDNPVILEHMGDIYRKLDKSKQALLLYEKALKQTMTNKQIQEKINQIHGR